jgi:hypothetical protein
VYDARDVSEKDDDHEKQAFTLNPLGFDGVVNRDGPTNTKTS